MSADPHYQATEEAHTGPIKNPKQLLLAVFFSFIIPILIIVGLVSYVVSGNKPAGTAEGDNMALYGVTKEARDREVAERLKKIGAIEIRDANRPLAAGEAVFKAQCATCHGAPGIPGAPHFQDAAAWGPRIGQGYATLLEHALKGKGAMPAQGGGDFEDLEVGRAVVYMANAGGAKFPVPDRPAAAAPAEGASGAAPATGAASAAAPAAPAASEASAAPK
ncbi:MULTISPECIES: cytochrome c5 family protein [unclassified Variovorax]|jgi:cytochrome c5|uniref:c-type cytochrome n=1 Tax=unclassified Variovorax TaxID=663243 RepID=UPI0008B61983|nr:MULTISPECIES: c-type cytochrome [unclassified Variovorax]SEK14352.1 Cytochrome C oxidase, cbb3-type, subunit III [Variovorax sp. OK202]SFD97061.1 Cytochrome C oxidase, cbb3-type, subunit III [Variovorax sp. OK212]